MTDSAIKYVGVDGCKEGWIGIGLSDGDCWDVHVCKDFANLVACFGDACVILVDVPIGLLEEMQPGGRDCDKEARKKLRDRRERQSSVFSAPIRSLVGKVLKMENPDWWPGCGVNKQTFAIIPKVAKADEALSPPREGVLSKVREAHPEVCFWALNGEPMSVKKSKPLGFWQRFRVVRDHLHDVAGTDVVDMFEKVRHEYKKGQVADDDILDAIVLAITAKIVSQNPERLGTLPENPPKDSKGLPMEMVYALPSDEGPPC